LRRARPRFGIGGGAAGGPASRARRAGLPERAAAAIRERGHPIRAAVGSDSNAVPRRAANSPRRLCD